MRYYRLIILFFTIFMGCKTIKTTTSSNHYEDLSIHREKIETSEQSSVKNMNNSATIQSYKPLTGHIGNEMDSVNRMAIRRNKRGKEINGYTILIYSGTNRASANNAKYKATALYPNLSSKLKYNQPTFRVTLGGFTDRLYANKMHYMVKEEFSSAILIPKRIKIQYD